MHTTTAAWRAEQRDHSIAQAGADIEAARTAASGPDRLGALKESGERIERAIRMEVGIARGVGVTWAEIGAALGVSRQAAHARYGSPNGAGLD